MAFLAEKETVDWDLLGGGCRWLTIDGFHWAHSCSMICPELGRLWERAEFAVVPLHFYRLRLRLRFLDGSPLSFRPRFGAFRQHDTLAGRNDGLHRVVEALERLRAFNHLRLGLHATILAQEYTYWR